MENTIEKKVWAPEYDKKSWMHRAQGVTSLMLSSFFGYFGMKYNMPLVEAGSVLFFMDGTGDLITGYHHYCGQKAIEGVEYLIKKIKN